MLNAALNLLEIELSSFKEDRKTLMYRITSEESDIIKFKSRLSNISPNAEKALRKVNNRLASLNESLTNLRSTLCELESLITKLENYLVELKKPEISYQFLFNIYEERYRYLHTQEIVKEINSKNAYRSYIKDKQKRSFSTMSSKRSYSTLSISKKINNTKINIRNMSLSSLMKNEIIHSKLMFLLYSGDNYQNIQRKIEEYLISEQNILTKKNLAGPGPHR